MDSTIQFFIGKGGVGKSTTSALAALNLALLGNNTLLVSMDPAHNQSDIFQRQFSEKPKPVTRNLAVKEVDLDCWMATYLRETQVQLKKAYSYQSAFNLHNYYNLLKYSPGLEEHALLMAFEHTLHTEKQREKIIFDMPPTALTMRFFSLPFITIVWLKELLKLRHHILDKKNIVSKIKFGKREIEQDKVKSRLQFLIDAHCTLQEDLTADSTAINLVLNNDRLSFSEAKRVRRKLADIGFDIDRILINKVKNKARIEKIRNEFNCYPIHQFPLSPFELNGLESLKRYIKEFDEWLL